MIRMAIIYNKADGSSFDFDYYVDSHMPMAAAEFGASRWDVDRIVSPDSPIHCIGYLYFKDEAQRSKGMTDAALKKVGGDVPNYYSPGLPTAVISEVVEG